MWVLRQKQAVTIMFSRLWVESLSRCFHLGREDSFQSKILEQIWFMVNCVWVHITRTAVPGCEWSLLYVPEVGQCSFRTVLKTFSDPTDPENKPVCPCRRSPSVCCTHDSWHSVIMWHTANQFRKNTQNKIKICRREFKRSIWPIMSRHCLQWII